MTEPRRYCTRKSGECGDQWCGKTRGESCCIYEYVESAARPEYNYAGPDWPPPRRWIAKDGTIVYRTYSDYVD